MIEENPSKPQAPLSREAGSGASGTPVMSPWGPIEGASSGSGTVTDPSGSGAKPPGYADLEPLA